MRRLYIVKCCGTKGCMPLKSRSPTWSNRNSSVIGSAASAINSTTFVEGQDTADKNQSIFPEILATHILRDWGPSAPT